MACCGAAKACHAAFAGIRLLIGRFLSNFRVEAALLHD
jgi:hypothetical protein